jgi:hypothetical protein
MVPTVVVLPGVAESNEIRLCAPVTASGVVTANTVLGTVRSSSGSTRSVADRGRSELRDFLL